MSCYHPIPALNLGPGLKPKILPCRVDTNLRTLRDKYGGDLLLLPCGKCIGCALDYAKTWSVRIMLESTLHVDNCFITLTYRDDCRPEKADKRAMQLFIKRLRKKFGSDIRFFGCGEYGSIGGNFHMHLILFGCDFPDKQFLMTTASGEKVYTSVILSLLWPYGFSSIGEVSSASAAYVARYSFKKVSYGVRDDSFILMSRKPGIGAGLYEKQWFASSKIYMQDGTYSIPRFFQKMCENLEPDFFADWKEAQKQFEMPSRLALYQVENEEDVYRLMEAHHLAHFQDRRM